jgi:hypothetical protein
VRNFEERNTYEEPDFLEEETFEPELELTRQERRWIIWGTLRVALMIGAVYIVGGALLIWLMLTIWS